MKKTGILIICVLLAGLSMSFILNQAQWQDDFFERIRTTKVKSDSNIIWKNFGPGMSGYCEEFWCHPTDTNVMFMGPDMHVSYGTWDNGKSWHSLKDCDGDGKDMERVLDIKFSLINPDYGVAIERYGNVFETKDRGRSWQLVHVIERQDNFWFHAHTKIAIHPENDSIWLIGAGDFWNMKHNRRTKSKPHGVKNRIASYGYILKTADRGQTWSKIATDISKDLDVGRIVYNPNYTDSIIIATSHGLFLSGDAGQTWVEGNSGLPNNLPRDLTSYYNPETKEFILYLAEQSVYKENGNTVSCNGGIFRSSNGGKSWEDITTNLYLDLNKINYMAEIERYYRTISIWFGMKKNVVKEKFPELPTHVLPVFNRMVVNPKNKDEIYVSYNKKHGLSFGIGDVWKTENGGKTWYSCARYGSYWINGKDDDYWKSRGNPIGTNIEFAHLQVYMDNGQGYSGNRMMAINAVGQIIIGVDQQTLRSNNGGEGWVQVDDNETSPGSNKWIGRGGSNLPGRFMLLETGIHGRYLLCSGEHGLWQTTDLDGWPDKQAVAVEQIEGQVHDHDGRHSAHSISTVAVHPNDPNTIYILAWRQEHRGKLRRTTDGGKTWKNIAKIFDADNNSWEKLATQNSLIIDPDNPDNMYFCAVYNRITEIAGGRGPDLTMGEYGVYRSSDGGYTWATGNIGFPDNSSIHKIIMDPDNPEILYAAMNQWSVTDPGGLYKSTDKALGWTKMNTPAEVKSVNNVFIDRNTRHIYISCGSRNGTYESGGVWRSKDEGMSWEKIFKAPYVWQAEVSPVNPDIIVVNAADQVSGLNNFKNPGLYLTQDGGNTWKKINRGLGNPDKMVDVKPDPNNENVLWCAGWGSGWFVAYLNGSTEGWLVD